MINLGVLARLGVAIKEVTGQESIADVPVYLVVQRQDRKVERISLDFTGVTPAIEIQLRQPGKLQLQPHLTEEERHALLDIEGKGEI
jgi:hypothetical protein